MNLLSLIESMQANPTAELVITMDPVHPAYIRDSANHEKFLDGPFEQEEYQPLIDSGQLVESEEFCSVFVLAAAATPPDFSKQNLAACSRPSEVYTSAELEEILNSCKTKFRFDDNEKEIKFDAAGFIRRELMSGRCYLCVDKLPGGTRATLASRKDCDTVAGFFKPNDYEFLCYSPNYQWSQYDETTWFVMYKPTSPMFGCDQNSELPSVTPAEKEERREEIHSECCEQSAPQEQPKSEANSKCFSSVDRWDTPNTSLFLVGFLSGIPVGWFLKKIVPVVINILKSIPY